MEGKMTSLAVRDRKFAVLMLAGCSLAVLASPALAQDDTATPAQGDTTPGSVAAPPAPAQDSINQNDIVVTAQRRAERLENVPMSIAALPAANLERQGVFDFDNLTRATAGVQI